MAAKWVLRVRTKSDEIVREFDAEPKAVECDMTGYEGTGFVGWATDTDYPQKAVYQPVVRQTELVHWQATEVDV